MPDDKALDVNVLIQVESSEATGDALYAVVRIFGIGGRVCTEIRTTRKPSPDEKESIERALEEIVRRETGAEVLNVESEHFKDEGELQKSIRKHLGGGKG
jgi:hypothetical protein